jgi:hypothetical protein
VLEEIRDAVMGLTIPEALTTELEAACKTAGFPTELTADMGKKDQPLLFGNWCTAHAAPPITLAT